MLKERRIFKQTQANIIVILPVPVMHFWYFVLVVELETNFLPNLNNYDDNENV